ncbi:D-alanyl-D-alanine carboxypeptidase DacB precursor [Ferrovum sp. JA12]|uniref:D-alanyl-D-alanine carboxypeptidase/D-alanyl-D-alanine endopeptidase n=1 Tax=Ferrovum sp. JA12 TaxID=1356299 RepID=UPI00070286E3|nr:D-alanyl-D-alanine carboxypeptidase/D-alanyl-D-alanine-endopeptidase [Ferrovum sp. JA12]KRH79481.1 D-alanyl-D-alanine carboxypeptidase DacB precursor [Ferrovum sp. JA12]
MQNSRVLLFNFLLFVFIVGLGLSTPLEADELPDHLIGILQELGINPHHVGVVIQKVSSPTPFLSYNERSRYQPASIIKIVTAYSSLSLLGPNYTWSTSIKGYISKSGEVNQDLVVSAQGDPFFTLEDWFSLWQNLYMLGIHNINANILIDNDRYQIDYQNPDRFDHQGDRVYNLIPHPLTIDFDRVALIITPINKTIHLTADFKWKNIYLINKLISSNATCPKDPEENLNVVTSTQQEKIVIKVSGEWPQSCGIGHISRRLMTNETIIENSMRQIWAQLGGQFTGKILFNGPHEILPTLVEHRSLPLFVLIPLMNKYSNNVMARMIFLNTGSVDADNKTSYKLAQAVIKQFVSNKGLNSTDLFIDNGSGLSRQAFVTPVLLNSLLQTIWRDPVGHEVVSSLPLMGTEGTLYEKQSNLVETNKMFLKTGTLNNVKGVAGFVQTRTGDWYTLVCLVNDENAKKSSPFIHGLLDWLYLTQ